MPRLCREKCSQACFHGCFIDPRRKGVVSNSARKGEPCVKNPGIFPVCTSRREVARRRSVGFSGRDTSISRFSKKRPGCRLHSSSLVRLPIQFRRQIDLSLRPKEVMALILWLSSSRYPLDRKDQKR